MYHIIYIILYTTTGSGMVSYLVYSGRYKDVGAWLIFNLKYSENWWRESDQNDCGKPDKTERL